MAIDVLKYSAICEMIPTMLNGVFIPSVEIISIYRSIFGLVFIFFLFSFYFKNKFGVLLFITYVIYNFILNVHCADANSSEEKD